MKHVIIGTAGHVDHGKTALVKALTGQDTDRLQEEKERGISIDLGFAHMSLSDTLKASIVDVPGHERFLKNMLAGVGGIDLALLIVAADEGVMPQTVEHLAMLDLYGVKAGVVVITKIDKVDGEWLDLITEEVRARTKDTFLAGAPVLYVSAYTGAGIAGLRSAIIAAAAKQAGRESNAPFRMWVDRIFSVKGHGVVVTGSILSGVVNTGDVLQLLPQAATVKARGIETHGVTADKATAGQRTAINITGCEAAQVGRGILLTALERSHTDRIWDAAIEWRQAIKSGTRIRLHIGTGEWIGRIRLPRFLPDGMVRLSLEKPLPAGCGEKGILRLYSPQTLLAGVVLLAPSRLFRPAAPLALAEAAKAGDAARLIATIISAAGKPLSVADVKRATGYLADNSCEAEIRRLENSKALLRLGDSLLAAKDVTGLGEKLISRLMRFHQESPTAPGIGREEVRQYLALDEKWVEELLSKWQQQGLIYAAGATVALTGHSAAHSRWLDDVSQRVEAALDGQTLRHIDAESLAETLNMKPTEAKAMYDNLLRAKRLVRLGSIVVHSKTLQYNISLIQGHLRQKETATAAELRDILQTSRKIAIPVLEYCDMHKYTLRNGDVRKIGVKIAPL